MADEPCPMVMPLVHSISMFFFVCVCVFRTLGSASECRVFGLILRPLYNRLKKNMDAL